MSDISTVLGLAAFVFAVGVSYYAYDVYAQKRFGRAGFKPKQFLSPNEVDFYRKLVTAAGAEWVICPQVSMGALMNTTLTEKHPDYWAARGLFSAKICDFVLCDAKHLKPRLIVELDDVMHDFKKDEKRDTLCALAGYRTIRFWSRKKPTVAELKEILNKELALVVVD